MTVKRKPDENSQTTSLQGAISEAELNIPDNARGEFTKGAKAMGKNDFDRARTYFTRATEIYPRYAEAFNALGVIAMNSKSPSEGRAFFERAIQADDKHPAAFVNMAKILVGEHHVAEATNMVMKSIVLDPRNAESQSLLCYFQLLQGKLEDAAGTVKVVHGLPHERFAMVHYMVANALERQQKTLEAIEEYKLFLKEAQTGPQVERARGALAALEHPPK
ncbi:MAG: tetratricopeptide repeat protein [Acidobacteriales bacterium]|nr:tetratricopeptide repeat protein [Terriglobales bacterium]